MTTTIDSANQVWIVSRKSVAHVILALVSFVSYSCLSVWLAGHVHHHPAISDLLQEPIPYMVVAFAFAALLAFTTLLEILDGSKESLFVLFMVPPTAGILFPVVVALVVVAAITVICMLMYHTFFAVVDKIERRFLGTLGDPFAVVRQNSKRQPSDNPYQSPLD